MGLFNYVRCRYPLPDAEAQDLLFQTKSMLDLQLATYEVTPDGKLIQVAYNQLRKSEIRK